MPYRWSDPAPDGARALVLWPHRSLSPRGFVVFIAGSALLLSLPLLTQVGHSSLWVLLPFCLIPLAGVWYALDRNNRDRTIVEQLTIRPELARLVRRQSGRDQLEWQANPHWVRVTLHETGGPVPNYLTLRGNGREVEIGAFLSEEERVALERELHTALALAR